MHTLFRLHDDIVKLLPERIIWLESGWLDILCSRDRGAKRSFKFQRIIVRLFEYKNRVNDKRSFER